MKQLIIIILATSAFCSCNENASKAKLENTDTVTTVREVLDTVNTPSEIMPDTNIVTTATDSHHTAKNSLDWNGTYKGVLPCADCEGLQTQIMLHSDNTYMISTKYLGKKDSHEMKGKGKFVWVDGSTIQLQDVKDAPSKYFVAENEIIQLDMEGNKIAGALAKKYILQKTH